MVYNPFFSDFPDLDKGQAHLDVRYKDGKFLDYESNKEIQLTYDPKTNPNGILLRLQVPLFSLEKEMQKVHLKWRKGLFLQKNTILYFGINDLSFFCELVDDLYLHQVGNRTEKLSSCKCKVIGAENDQGKPLANFIIKTYASLNQAYTGTSIDHFPERKYHTGNAFKKFFTKDNTRLEDLRGRIELK